MSIGVPVAQNDDNNTFATNFIDTYVEYIAEVILKYDNAIPEAGKRHQKQLQQHKLCQVICEQLPFNIYQLKYSVIKEKYFNQPDSYVYQFSKEISPPPELKILHALFSI